MSRALIWWWDTALAWGGKPELHCNCWQQMRRLERAKQLQLQSQRQEALQLLRQVAKRRLQSLERIGDTPSCLPLGRLATLRPPGRLRNALRIPTSALRSEHWALR